MQSAGALGLSAGSPAQPGPARPGPGGSGDVVVGCGPVGSRQPDSPQPPLAQEEGGRARQGAQTWRAPLGWGRVPKGLEGTWPTTCEDRAGLHPL